jgi:hypothetical protein
MAGMNEPNQSRDLTQAKEQEETDEPTRTTNLGRLSQMELTHREWDSGSGMMTQEGSAELTGKLCQQVMALICWRVGADKAVTDCMVQALEEWLHRRGISIYTDLV